MDEKLLCAGPKTEILRIDKDVAPHRKQQILNTKLQTLCDHAYSAGFKFRLVNIAIDGDSVVVAYELEVGPTYNPHV